jgi:hypothetical protein
MFYNTSRSQWAFQVEMWPLVETQRSLVLAFSGLRQYCDRSGWTVSNFFFNLWYDVWSVNLLRSLWSIGPHFIEVSVAVLFFMRVRLLASRLNPQPGGPGCSS